MPCRSRHTTPLDGHAVLASTNHDTSVLAVADVTIRNGYVAVRTRLDMDARIPGCSNEAATLFGELDPLWQGI